MYYSTKNSVYVQYKYLWKKKIQILYIVCLQNQCTQKIIGIYDPTVGPHVPKRNSNNRYAYRVLNNISDEVIQSVSCFCRNMVYYILFI